MSAVYWFSASCLYFQVMDCLRGWVGLWPPWGEDLCWPPFCFWGEESRWAPPCCGRDVTERCLFWRRFRATAAGERVVPCVKWSRKVTSTTFVRFIYPLPGCEDFLSSLCELPLGAEVGGSDKRTFISSSTGHRQKSVGLKPFFTQYELSSYISSSNPKKKPFSQEELWIPFLWKVSWIQELPTHSHPFGEYYGSRNI